MIDLVAGLSAVAVAITVAVLYLDLVHGLRKRGFFRSEEWQRYTRPEIQDPHREVETIDNRKRHQRMR